ASAGGGPNVVLVDGGPGVGDHARVEEHAAGDPPDGRVPDLELSVQAAEDADVSAGGEHAHLGGAVERRNGHHDELGLEPVVLVATHGRVPAGKVALGLG